MTFTVTELRLLLEALDMAVSRHQSQANFYEARPDRFSRDVVNKHVNRSADMHALSCKLAAFKPRHSVLEVA